MSNNFSKKLSSSKIFLGGTVAHSFLWGGKLSLPETYPKLNDFQPLSADCKALHILAQLEIGKFLMEKLIFILQGI